MTQYLRSNSTIFFLFASFICFSQASVEKYIPYDNCSFDTHPQIEIRTVVHVVKRFEHDAQNLNEDSVKFLEQQFKWINEFYGKLAKPSLLAKDGREYWIPDSRIRFVIDTIIFHTDSIGWDRIYSKEIHENALSIMEVNREDNSFTLDSRLLSHSNLRPKIGSFVDSLNLYDNYGESHIVHIRFITDNKENNTTIIDVKEDLSNLPKLVACTYFKETNVNCKLDLWEQYASGDKYALHVFYTGSSKSSIAFGCGPTAYYLNVSNLIKGGDWAGAQLTAHELGHTIGLRHTDFPQFDDLPKSDKFGFIPCDNQRTSNNIMGYNVCRNYLSPKQIGYVHGLYNTNVDRIRLTYANEYIDTSKIFIRDSTLWDKSIQIRQDIIVKRGQTLIITEPLHMAEGTKIYVEARAKLVVKGEGKIYNCFGTNWEGVTLCKSYLRKNKMPCKKKNYGSVEASQNSILNTLQK